MPRTILLLSSGLIGLVAATPAAAANSRFAERCAALAESTAYGVNQALFQPIAPAPSGSPMTPPNPPGLMIPAHCDVQGLLDQRIGIDGQHYAIRYHLRLPENWNGKFFFQGGAGTNGVVGDALGSIGAGRPPAIVLGYAVVSQDSGHDNRLNNDPARGGETVFGGDPEARADYGGTSLKRVADTAKAVVARFYGKPAARSYFFGCSKGGQEGMAFAQRYPTEFDGIVAGAPDSPCRERHWRRYGMSRRMARSCASREIRASTSVRFPPLLATPSWHWYGKPSSPPATPRTA